MQINELIDTIDALMLLPETDETRENRNALQKLVIDTIRSATNDDWVMLLLQALRRERKK